MWLSRHLISLNNEWFPFHFEVCVHKSFQINCDSFHLFRKIFKFSFRSTESFFEPMKNINQLFTWNPPRPQKTSWSMICYDSHFTSFIWRLSTFALAVGRRKWKYFYRIFFPSYGSIWKFNETSTDFLVFPHRMINTSLKYEKKVVRKVLRLYLRFAPFFLYTSHRHDNGMWEEE